MSFTAEQQELHDTYKNLSAPELEAMLDEEDPDASLVINALLSGGKQVELKAGSTRDDESGDGREVTHHSYGMGQEDGDGDGDEDNDDDTDPAADAAQAGAAAAADAAAAVADPAADAGAVAEPEAVDTSALADGHSGSLAPLDLTVAESRYRTSIDALKEEKAAKLRQMLDGEIEPDEYSKYESEYEDKRDALKEQKQGEIEWMGQVHAFKVQALKETGINYDTDAEKSTAFDDWLKRLAANPANEHRSEAWFLEQAHKKVCTEFDVAPKAAAAPAPAAPAKPAEPAKPQARRADTSAIPPTLGGLPAAVSSEAGDEGEFGHIYKLTGMAYEKAIAAMTPAQRERFESE